MSEGAQFPWKLQKVQQSPTVSYKSIKKPLRAPPGKRWHFEPSTKEWSLEDIPKSIVDGIPHAGDAAIVVNALLVDGDGNLVVNGNATRGKSPYLEHIVQESDTFEGICLRYKLTPSELRRANGFSGSNLQLAPNPLKIPTANITATNAEAVALGSDDGALPRALTTEQVIQVLIKDCPGLSRTEANAYLELNDWEISEALKNAKEDGF
jgi:LysM repeat protein